MLFLFRVSLDPTVHYTWWSLLLGGGSVCLTSLAVNQMHFQRIKTAKYVYVYHTLHSKLLRLKLYKIFKISFIIIAFEKRT